MRYQTIAEAYRDLEQVTGRLALTDRLAALLAATPAGLLPVVCYLCQGLIAPEFAGVDLGLAEKLAVRAVATATGTDPGQVTALVREIGDLGQAAEQLLVTDRGRAGGTRLTVPTGVGLGIGPCIRSLRPRAGLAGAQAGPAGRPARPGHPAGGALPAAAGHQGAAAGHRHAHHFGRAGSGVRGRPGPPAGAGTRLQHLLRPGPGRRRPGRGRPGRGGQIRSAAGQPGAGHAGPAAGRCDRDPGQAGRPVRGGVQMTGSGYRPTAPPTGRSSCSPGGLSAFDQSPTWFSPWRRAAPRGDPGGEVVATTRPRASCGRSARSCSGGVPRHRPGGAGPAGGAVLFRAAVRRRK